MGQTEYVDTQKPKKIIALAKDVTIDAGGSESYTNEILLGHSFGAITVRVTYDSSAGSGATLNTYYSQDGKNFDTEPVSEAIAFTAGETKQETIYVNVACKAVKVEVVNEDGSYALTLNGLWMATAP